MCAMEQKPDPESQNSDIHRLENEFYDSLRMVSTTSAGKLPRAYALRSPSQFLGIVDHKD